MNLTNFQRGRSIIFFNQEVQAFLVRNQTRLSIGNAQQYFSAWAVTTACLNSFNNDFSDLFTFSIHQASFSPHLYLFLYAISSPCKSLPIFCLDWLTSSYHATLCNYYGAVMKKEKLLVVELQNI